MHDLDRTQLEEEYEAAGLEYGSQGEQFLGLLGPIFGGELEALPIPELEEIQLASELLETTTEQELDRFLGDVLRAAGRAAGAFVRSDTGRALTGVMKGAAKKVLPVMGGAVGGWVTPGGATVGRRLGDAAADLLGLELEGLSAEDREFEAARHFVRFLAAACRQGLGAPSTAPAPIVARRAVETAAHRYAPGFARLLGGGVPPSSTNGVPGASPMSVAPGAPDTANWLGGQQQAQSGRWVMQGNVVVLYGL
jgi:hypothetical protein